MLSQVPCRRSSERVEDNIDTFAPRELRRRHEVAVPCYHYYLIDLALERERRDIKS